MGASTRTWLHGLVAALIGGGSSGVISALTAIGIDPNTFNLAGNFGHTATLAGTTFLVSAVLSALLYLKQSPLPPETDSAGK